MGNTSITRRFQAAGLAFAVFSVGAGIGWQFADLLFRVELPTPMVASIQLEGAGPHEAFGREQISTPGHGAVRESAPVLDPVPYQAVEEPRQIQIDTVAKSSDEERKLVEALQWVDKYRQRQEAAAWEAVGRHQLEMQKLAQAQIERALTRTDSSIGKLAEAGIKLQMGAQIEMIAGQSTAVVKVHQARKQDGTVKRRVVHRQRPQSYELVPQAMMCPLRWLEAVVVGAAMERRVGHRQHRRAAAG